MNINEKTRLILNISIFIAGILILGGFTAASLMKYHKLSRYSEVPHNLRKIYESAVVYGERRHVDPVTNELLPHEFPVSQSVTPSIRCCNGRKPQKCVPGKKGVTGYNPEEWKTDTWKDLKFKMTDPHFYRYQFKNTSFGKIKSFKVIARGDIDCDGRESYFWRTGRIYNHIVQGSAEIFEKDPDE